MQQIKCPQCGKMTEFKGNEYRPFCSERCKLLDFGAWADGDYAIPSQTSNLSESDADEIEKAMEDRQ